MARIFGSIALGAISCATTMKVPKLWDEKALADWATPVAGLGVAPGFVGEKEYYAAPIDNLRTYPVYHPDREPAGYRDWLRSQGPKPLIEPAKLRTESDWIEAGRRVFEELDTAVMRTADPAVLAYFGDRAQVDAHRDASHDVMDKDGVLLDFRWVVDRDGTLKMSVSSCAGCHTRLMPDGSLLRGAPCNFDLAESPAAEVMLSQLLPVPLPKGQQFYEDFGVPGFEPNREDPATARLDISVRRVETDPGLALKTRKGTGYYKVPSLRGLWYRGLYEHSGSVRTLEDWFDRNRLRDDYVPTGWRGPGVKTRSVPGHRFGLDLRDADKRALIAFLLTI